jgi:flagellar protein FlaG
VASTSMETMILFIAGLVVAVGVAGALTGQVQQLSAAIDDTGVDAAEQIRTDVEIVSDAGSPVYDTLGNGNVTVYVKNTGSENLPADPDQLEVLLDGRYAANVSLSVVDGDGWDTGNVVNVSVSEPGLASGDHRLKLIVNGDEEVFEFRT